MFNKKNKQNNKDVKFAESANAANASDANGKVLSGVVVSDKMTDTGVVEVQRYFKHPKYGKFIKTGKKYKFHDVGNTAKIGDKVRITETKPISKDKKFRLLEIVSVAPVVDLSDVDADTADATDVTVDSNN